MILSRDIAFHPELTIRGVLFDSGIAIRNGRGTIAGTDSLAMASICSLSSVVQAPPQLRSCCGELSGTGSQALGFRVAHCVPTNAPFLVQPRASRKCDLTGKKANNGYLVSFSNHRTKKLQGANLQYKRLWWEEANRFVKLRISTKALKTIEKKGLAAMAKEAGIDLLDYAV